MSAEDWTLDADAAQQALDLFKSARRVLMPTHQNVDADGLASPLAMMHSLAQCGIEVTPLISDGQYPRSLEFLPGIEKVCVYGEDELPDYDLLCLADCSDKRRLGAFYSDDETRIEGSTPIVNIDHHVTNDRFGVVNIVEPKAASTAEIVADLLKLWGTKLNPKIAQCLLAGIYGDTLGLRTEATTSRTMRTAADLVDAGANPVPIVDRALSPKTKIIGLSVGTSSRQGPNDRRSYLDRIDR